MQERDGEGIQLEMATQPKPVYPAIAPHPFPPPPFPPPRNLPTGPKTPFANTRFLPQSTLRALPQNYTMRPLSRSDYKAGHLETLRALTIVGEIAEAQWVERYEWMKARSDEYFVLVVCDGEGKVVGTGCVVVERKL